jgi:Mrp family chromosome partitioning ATPase
MGRMLEALKRVPASAAAEAAALPDAAAAAALEPAESAACEVPYIEVGGAGRTVEASPSVTLPSASLPKAVGERSLRLNPPALRTPVLTGTGPRDVCFLEREPAPADPGPRVASEIVAFHHPDHAMSGQYRSLFTRIHDGMMTSPPHLLMFTGVTPGAGTTTALLNLAVTGSAGGARRVAVVDANLCRPAAAQRLGVVPTAGLTEVLRGNVALERALAASPQPHMQVLGAVALAEPERLLTEENLRWLGARLRERFDLIFLDGPAWGSDATLALGALADAVYLVLEGAEVDTPAVRRITRALAQRGCRLGGFLTIQ